MDKFIDISSVKVANKEERIIEFVGMKEVRDLDNDIVKLDGMDLSTMKKTKSLLWSHSQSQPPIGKVLRIWKDGNVLRGKAQFTSEEEYPFGYTIYKLVAGNYINSISISFLPDWKSIEYKEDKKTGTRTQIINKSTLLECSIVNVPCNPGTSIETKTIRKGVDDAWTSGELDGIELNLMTDALDKIEAESEDTTNAEEIDYQKQIDDLKAEMKELKDGSYLYSIFDKEESELDEFYDTLTQEKQERDDILQEAIDALKE